MTRVCTSAFLLITLFSCNLTKRQRSLLVIDQPRLFSTEIETRNGIAFSFSGEKLYISLQKEDTFDNGRQAAGIFEYRFDKNVWKGPFPLLEVGFDAYHPVLSRNGKRLFFNSRFHPDSTKRYLKHDLWYIDQMGQGWSAPTPITTVNTEHYESYPTVAANGNLYFNSDRPGGEGGMDIYKSEFKNGSYLPPTRVEGLSSEHEENDLTVDPFERFMIFNRYIHADQSIDLWISFNENGNWSEPRLLDTINQDNVWELTPSLSPDGKYFFWEVNNKIWQIELAYLVSR